ncbi:hypothetical protein BDV96DRAFT_564785 [Lophiotrema nucula]|uniref:Uncharacterized protein n=1 Tax=Lophiotrema nucula TaxID=690887 RepID=A0A6A5ZNH4_9PLEO|nr:hypothetical protein BDV96DRAFT_564785 [Lophiotrema nucula]
MAVDATTAFLRASTAFQLVSHLGSTSAIKIEQVGCTERASKHFSFTWTEWAVSRDLSKEQSRSDHQHSS